MRPYLTRLLTPLLALPLAADAATFTWPSSVPGSPCAGTLQACITQAAAGDTVEIGADETVAPDAYTAINEDVQISRSLTLRAAEGIDAVFAPERELRVDLGSGAHSVTLADLSFRRGGVLVTDASTVDGGTLALRGLRIVETGAATQAPGTCAIQILANGSAARQISVGDSTVARGGTRPGDAFGGICLTQEGSGALTVTLFRNRVLPGLGSSSFGLVAFNLASRSSARASGNRVFGPRSDSALYLHAREPGATLRAESNLISGSSGGNFALVMNVPGGSGSILNNTVVHGERGLAAGGLGSTPPTTLRVANNLIAWQSVSGLVLGPTGISNSHNAVFATGGNTWTPGPGTVTEDPRIESPGYPRPRSGSPLINRGSAADTGGQLFDVDGERRTAFGTIDIGAFELTSDAAAVITADTATAFFNEVYISPFPIELLAVDTFAVTAHRMTPTTPGSGQHLGVYRNPASPSGWSLFQQDSAVGVSLGQRFSVLVPVASKTGFTHTTAAANVSGAISRIDHPSLNGLSAAIAIALHYWVGAYHDVPISLAWSGAGGGRWQLRNEDGRDMPADLPFHLVVAPPLSPNALQPFVGPATQGRLPLPHRLLDDNPCAAPVAGRVDDPLDAGNIGNPQRFSVAYRPPSGPGAAGRWTLVAEGGGAPGFPVGAGFNVIVDGAQAERCRAPREDRVFADGFEPRPGG